MRDAFKLVPVSHFCARPQYGLSIPAVSDGDVPIVGMKDLIGGRVDISNVARIKINGEAYKSYSLNAGDLLLNRTNSRELVGKLAIWDHDKSVKAVFASYLVRYPIRLEISDPRYVINALHLARTRHQIERLITPGVSQANINANAFYEDVAIPLPPLEEQRRIADILDAWDRAIGLIERRYKAATKLKQGLLHCVFLSNPTEQQDANIKRLKVGKIGHIIRGVSYDPATDLVQNRTPDSVRILTAANLSDFRLRLTGQEKHVRPGCAKAHQLVHRGDFIICMSNGSSDLVGKAGLASVDFPNCAPGAFNAIFRPHNDTYRQIALNYFESEPYRRQLYVALAGSSINNLSSSALSEFEIVYSSLDMSVFRSIDSEIDAVKPQYRLLNEQKRGLMQKLLSGDMRVSPMEAVK